MGPVTKISTLPSNTLETLRDKILLLLDNDLDHHINKWNTLLKNCKAVAERRHIPLDLPAAIQWIEQKDKNQVYLDGLNVEEMEY